MFKTGWGCLPLGWRSCSFQSAGVGGTGPRAVMPSGTGRLVGGEAMGSVVRFKLCDLEFDGGGPGGGGGSGKPGSHLDCDVDRDRADVGVSTALAEAARRALGGIAEESVSDRSSLCGIWRASGCGLEIGAC